MFRKPGQHSFLLIMIVHFLMPVSVFAANDVDNSDLEQLIDPTAPLNRVVQNTVQPNLFGLVSSYKVNSILIRPNTKIAVINSRQVREGDLIGNAEVKIIEKNTVTLEIAGEERVLELYGQSIKSLSEGSE